MRGCNAMCGRFLIVDDSKLVVEALLLVLEVAGMHGIEANSCSAAKQAAELGEFDVVLLDIHLPDGLGLELLPLFRSKQPQCPVLIYSFSTRPTHLARSHSLGASGYLVKGLENQKLLAAFRRALAGETLWTTTQLDTIAYAAHANYMSEIVSAD